MIITHYNPTKTLSRVVLHLLVSEVSLLIWLDTILLGREVSLLLGLAIRMGSVLAKRDRH